MANKIISRADAKAQGFKRYFTGESCRHGHVAERQVSNYACLVCQEARTVIWRVKTPRKQKEYSARRDRRLRLEHREAYNERKRQQRARNPDTSKNISRRYRERHPEKALATSRSWKERNRERSRELCRRWREAHPDAARLWHVINREKSRTNVRNRTARKRNAAGKHTAVELAEILIAQDYKCAYCRADLRKAKRDVDHINPLARGGSNDNSNLQYLCVPCNRSKGAKDPLEFAQQLGRLL